MESNNASVEPLENIVKKSIEDLIQPYTEVKSAFFKYAKKEKKPIFINLNGVLSEYAQKKKRLLKKLFNIFLKKALVNAKSIIVQTENEKKDAEKFHLKNLLLLNVGIDLKNFSNLPLRSVFRDKYNLKDDEIAILFLARIAEIKGLKYLIAVSYTHLTLPTTPYV